MNTHPAGDEANPWPSFHPDRSAATCDDSC